MNRFFLLLKGELLRFHKYKVTLISLLIALIWGLALGFIKDLDMLTLMLPQIIIVDATMMSVIFIGAMMFFEKTEQTISTLLVTPTNYHQQILSKAVANTIQLIVSSLLIVLVFYFIKQVEVHFLWVLISLLVAALFHSLLGFIFSYYTKDFTTMLLWVMLYSFIFTIPSILHGLGIIFKEDIWDYILLILPSEAASNLILAGFNQANLMTYLSLAYLLVIGALLYIFLVLPQYKKYVVKQSGV